MAKKKKKQNRKKRIENSVAKLTVQQLEEKGMGLLDSGSFQQAAKYFKELLKKEDSEEFRQLLAQANRGRVGRLLKKNMVKEALVLLSAMERDFGSSGLESLHVQLLLKTGRLAEAASLYGVKRGKIDAKNSGLLDVLFGAYLLSGGEGQKEDLLPDSAVARHLPSADKAVVAYCSADNEAAERAVKEISFRSPYREVRLLIKGLMLFEENPEKARTFLDKIDSDSPFRRLADFYGLRFGEPAAILTALSGASPAQRKVFETVLGLDRKRLTVLAGLAGSENKPQRLYRVVTSSGNCLADDLKKSLTQRILPHCGIDVMSILERSRQFPEMEMIRLIALAAQLDGEPTIAVEMWDDFLERTEKLTPENTLIRALILRHQAMLMQRGRYFFYPDEILQKLEKSLEYDPVDKKTWLQAFEIAANSDERKHYHLVNRAIEFFPDDADMLLKIIEAAAQRGAFKKASRFADRLLAIDPINTRAKELLVEARLAHGRKLAGQGKAQLARREFEAAGANTRSVRYQGRHFICLGMLSLLEKRDEEGLALIEQGGRQGASPLSFKLLTAVEARLMKMNAGRLKQFDKEVRRAAAHQAEKQEILRIAGWVKSFSGRHWHALAESCKALVKFFRQAADMEWSREEGLLICRSLLRAALFPPLEKLAVALLAKWPEHPELEFYRIRARSEKRDRKISAADVDRLEDALEAAVKKGDYDLADRIDYLLKQLRFRTGPARDFDFDDDVFPEDDDPFDDLFKLPASPPGKKEKQKPAEPAVTARQLNLFDLDK
ncbi:MAG: hypothetical protein KQH63_10310 [Desulfobulbaceae bacterium]|nr:hypothetical protein [Desulfobulbaceae bacterium]